MTRVYRAIRDAQGKLQLFDIFEDGRWQGSRGLVEVQNQIEKEGCNLVITEGMDEIILSPGYVNVFYFRK